MWHKFALIGAVLMVLCAAGLGTAVSAQSENTEHTIYVQGTGKVTTPPDQVTISFAVETEHTDVKIAQSKNAELMARVIDALKSAGLTSDELETSGYSIYETRQTSSGIASLGDRTVYRVSNTLTVTMKEIDRAGEIIDVAIGAGANRVNYITFGLTDETQLRLRAEALKGAVLSARSDADAVTAALGKTIVDVQTVSVSSGYIPYPTAKYDSYMASGAAERVETPIESGTIDVSASVSITYIIR